MKPCRAAFLILIFCLSSAIQDSVAMTSETVSFNNGNHSYAAYIFKPKGNGPFPALLWNHGHAKHLLSAGPISEYESLARFYTDAGYVLFLPDRHMNDINEKEYSQELQTLLQKSKSALRTKQRQYMEYLEINAKDILAALAWLKTQPYIDAQRIAMSGWNTGATAGLLTAAKAAGIRAYVPFSIGATRWQENEPMQTRLLKIVQTSKTPIFLIHSANDPTLVPSEILGSELARRGAPHQMQVYSFSSRSDIQVASLAIRGSGIWGPDVLRFLNTALAD